MTVQDYEIFDFDGPGVGMGMYNTEQAIRGFALSCFEYALEKQWCVPVTMARWAVHGAVNCLCGQSLE